MQGKGPLTTIKIPEGMIERARNKKALSSILFYYKVKLLNQEGFLRKNTIVPQIRDKYGISSATIWRQIKILIELDLMSKKPEGYRLCSYDKLFNFLEYDLTPNKIRKGSFIINKVDADFIEVLEQVASTIDIKANLDHQRHKVQQRFSNKTTPNNSTAKITVEDVRKSKLAKYVQEHNEMTGEGKQVDGLCRDITLSSRGISRVLGLKSVTQGWRIAQMLKKHGFVEIHKRVLFVETFGGTFREFRRKYSDPSYRFNDGSVYYNLSNLIIPLI